MKTKIAGYALLAITCITIISSCKKTVTPTFVPVPVSTLPVITTAGISSVTESTATCGGSVASEGQSGLLAVGICWDTLGNPTLLRPHTTDGAGIGSYTSKITGLKSNTTYYVRAYATNFTGTAYGNEVSFKTPLAWARVNSVNNNIFLFDMMVTNTGLLSGNQGQSGTNAISSNDNGVNWTLASSDIGSSYIYALYANGSTAYAVTNSGLYKSTNSGQQWTLGNDNTLNVLTCFTQQNSNTIGGGSNGIRINTNGTILWTTSNSGLGSNKMINALLSTGSTLFAATPVGCYKSTNDGASWSLANTGLGTNEIMAFGMINSTLFAAANNNNVYSSSDNGANWTQITTLNNSDIIGFVSSGNNIYGYSRDKGIFLSKDNGVTWTPMPSLPSLQIRTMVIKSGMLIMNSVGGGLYTYPVL